MKTVFCAKPGWIAALLAVSMAMATVAAGQGGPAAAAHPITADGQMHLSPLDRCPVCAMFPARHPETAAALTLKSGETFTFCSNGCLLRAWLRPGVYLGKQAKAIDRVVVRDFFSGQSIDGRSATWVAGSDVMGPMGRSIITLGKADHLAAFQKRHGGQWVFTFNEVDDALWQMISRRELPAAED